MMEARSPTAGVSFSEIELQAAPASSGMDRPTSGEAAANAANDVVEPPKGMAGRIKDSLVACFWELEEHLADMFGLNDSKYQWAVDRYFEEKKDKDDRAAFEAEEEEERAEEENAKLAADADKLEGGVAEASTVGLTSEAAAK